ncbi:agamous-like MADS-box protein AGL80 [Cicer arietinum]|uniref:Agamous-like MADS-box protein AGL80 n=1 Tax=Cicer arietinum TaxID=3827 RepID=A0A1S2Y772_CICAR|nr:agamous-like MADS-box protein AGL80 [Cicer arietinum]
MRNKVKLAFMINDSARKITYNKRKKSLMKKIKELTTLCGIDACAIVYSDFNSQPEVWPSPWEIERIITKFKAYSEYEQGKKMLDQESFLMQRIVKSKEQLTKVEKNNSEMEQSLILFQCLIRENFIYTLNTVVLNDLACVINEKLKGISLREDELDKNASTI